MRIIGMCCIFNGEQFLEHTINNITRKIRDINCLVFFDGAWVEGGNSSSSTDKTMEILQKFAELNPNIEIIVAKHPAEALWKNPSEKRNYALKKIDEMFNDEPYFVFWFDDDEEIRFRNGKEETWLRDNLATTSKDVFILQTYGWNVAKGMLTIRFIRGGKGYHWHTERAMQFHDKNCKVLLDWTPGMEIYPIDLTDSSEMFIVNKWNRRNVETLKQRDHYAAIENKQLQEDKPCRYQEVLVESHSH